MGKRNPDGQIVSVDALTQAQIDRFRDLESAMDADFKGDELQKVHSAWNLFVEENRFSTTVIRTLQNIFAREVEERAKPTL